ISIGFLNVFLLIGLISLGVHSHALGSLAADLTETKDNLQDSNDRLSANLTEMSNEMSRLQTLLKKKRTCPAGWRMFSFSCYLVSTKTDSWDEGREDCKNKGGDLVVIDNNEEQQTFVSKFTDKPAWIGLNNKEAEGSWKWVDGTSLNFKHWGYKQPDNGNG
uniref:C-type lectin domain-containing protein n=1 Tax=Poecilia formosa TaxID=48698 RepID=A0A087YBD4_POEFO